MRFLAACRAPASRPQRRMDPLPARRADAGGPGPPTPLRATDRSDPLARIHEAYGREGGATTESIQRADLKVWLPDDVLRKVDVTTMVHGLEVRAPLLDHQVVELALKIPPSMKMRRGAGEEAPERGLRGPSPAATLRRRKAGFGLPIDHWLRGPCAATCATCSPILRRSRAASCRARRWTRCWRSIAAGKANREDALWALVMLEHWCARYLDAGRYGLTRPGAERRGMIARLPRHHRAGSSVERSRTRSTPWRTSTAAASSRS